MNFLDDQINLSQTEYNHLFNQVKNQLLLKLREFVDKDVQLASNKTFEFCDMSFIGKVLFNISLFFRNFKN